MYKRFCAEVGQVLEFVHIDLEDQRDHRARDGVGRHLAAFHKWQNDERVNRGWGEQGTLENHREYLERLILDPGVLPVMMSWDGELMGYLEFVWVKVIVVQPEVLQHFRTLTCFQGKPCVPVYAGRCARL